MCKREGGKIEQWWIDRTTFGESQPVVRGYVVGDSYFGNSPLRTSVIVSINEDETELETLNTIYKLGEKRVAPDGLLH